MICCKIITDFSAIGGKFGRLLDSLGKYGDVLYENDVIYFGATEDMKVDKKKVKSIFRKSGYPECLILEYTKENPPKETDSLNGWINGKLMKINYNQYEIKSQEAFKNTMKGLDILERQIDMIQANQRQKEEGKDVR